MLFCACRSSLVYPSGKELLPSKIGGGGTSCHICILSSKIQTSHQGNVLLHFLHVFALLVCVVGFFKTILRCASFTPYALYWQDGMVMLITRWKLGLVDSPGTVLLRAGASWANRWVPECPSLPVPVVADFLASCLSEMLPASSNNAGPSCGWLLGHML